LSAGKPLPSSAHVRDADGWIVIWNLTSRRPSAVWKGHDAGVLSMRQWDEKLIRYRDSIANSYGSHGRDGKVVIWKVGESEERELDCGLPAHGGDRRKPGVFASFNVKEMTFCGVDAVTTTEVCKSRQSG
jgi:ASTRA-associated protein 1